MKFDDTYFMLFPYPICINLSSEQLNARFCRSHWQQHGTTLLHKAFLASRFAVIWLPICESTRKCTLGLSICYQPWTQKGYSGKVSLKHEHCNIVNILHLKGWHCNEPFQIWMFQMTNLWTAAFKYRGPWASKPPGCDIRSGDLLVKAGVCSFQRS